MSNVEVKVHGFSPPECEQHILFLKEVLGNKMLALSVNTTTLELLKMITGPEKTGPTNIDLVHIIIAALGGKFKKTVIARINVEDNFESYISLEDHAGIEIKLTFDIIHSIVLAVVAKKPIYVDTQVIEQLPDCHDIDYEAIDLNTVHPVGNA